MSPTPYEFQRQTLDFVEERHHSIVAHEPGLGKTMVGILGAELPALVVCPASVRGHWRREIERWRPDAADQFEVVSYADRDLFLMNPRHYQTLIVDEVHFIKNPTSQRSRLVCGLARRIGREGKTIALSGTLVPNRPIELWPLLWSTRVTDMSYEDFAYRYANAFIDYEYGGGELDVTGSSNEEELKALVEPHAIRYLKKDVLTDLPDKRFRVLALDLPLGQQEKEYTLAGVRRMRESVALEAMSAILAEQGRRKLPLVAEHVKSALEEEEKVVVFAHHREMIENLRRKLALYHPVHLWGGMTDRQKDSAVRCFADDPECRVFVGQIQAAGVGVDGLQEAASRAVFAEASWVPSDIQQCADRLHRHGQRDSVLADVLTVDGSIDEHQIRRALEKQKVVDKVVPTTEYIDPLA